ncbi:uncharacterized protein ACLA_045960 [Aspergillus clavatus NRRL 1]|uniref:Uncharacterized protein n=1 Tax=Aspergillus clavatus (strain ATCC 1007 / CBS 513.65 / DSM 816 / NCTC 3887 / NRRL 1 / QM 1276 / 107) TaxID=344612 RepID=A1CGX6_ASPCL|nr:uncharacterized protein ACLA_045960 [Aspergillus clavatus NRRL 1]EAW10131.1 conserved hypothetical protein [Aspergillus clavatus NRRL 1]
MGIPMYRDPSPEGTKSSTIKDPSAAARSAIRRQATLRRPSRYSTSTLRGAPLRSPFPRAIADEIEREAHGLQRHIRSPITNPPPGDDPLDIIAGDLDMIRREVGEGLLHEAAQHRRPGQRMRIPRNTALSELTRRPSPADNPSSRRNHEQPAFTPSFAPAVAYHRRLSPPSQLRPRLSPFPPDGFEVVGTTVPLLRRVGQRSINETNRAINRDFTMDGLGDRQRSMSPDDDNANDAWETLLTTITPDDNLPSADSSFASTSASGANTSANATTRTSTASFQTLPSSLDPSSATVQMVLDPYPEYVNPCDYPSSSDSDSASEGDFNQLSLWRRYRRRMHQMGSGQQRSHDMHSTMSSHPPIPTISFAFSNSSTHPEHQQMQAILDRLARRENIPDDWWAAAGLSRTISNRRGANNDSNDPDNREEPARRP